MDPGSRRHRRKLHPHEIEKQRKILIRRVSGVLVPVAVLIVGLGFLWTWQQKRTAEDIARRTQSPEATAAASSDPKAESGETEESPSGPAPTAIQYTAADVAEAFSRQGPERAYEILLEMEKVRPLRDIELHMMVDLCQNSGRISTARKYIDISMTEDPNNPETLALLSRQEAFEGNLDEAVRRLGEALSKFAGSWVTDQSTLLRTAADVSKRLLDAKRFEDVAAIVPEEAALRSRDLYMARLSALTGAGQRPRILTLIDRDPGYLRATERDRIRAANYWHLGRHDDARAAFDRALSLSLSERHARELLALGYLARDFRDDTRSLQAWDAYLSLPRVLETASAQIWIDILAANLRLRQTERALEIAEAMAARHPQHPLAIQQLAWLRFLTKKRMQPSITQLEQINESGQIPLELVLTLALGYVQNGDAPRALSLVAGVPVLWERLPPTFLVSYIAVLRANGQAEEADRLASSLNTSDLLPEELALIR